MQPKRTLDEIIQVVTEYIDKYPNAGRRKICVACGVNNVRLNELEKLGHIKLPPATKPAQIAKNGEHLGMTNLGTIEHVKAIYALCCKLPLFDKIQMPLPCQIEWIIVHDPELLGMYQPSPHTITISLARQSHFDTICRTVLHEMVHMLLYLQGKANYEKHDKTFKKWTHKIATIYGYDPKEL